MKFGTLIEQKKLYRMMAKSPKLNIAIKITHVVAIEAQIMTMGLTSKAMSNKNNFGVIQQSSFYSISVPNFIQKDPREVLFSEFFRKINEFKMAENIDFFTSNS